MKKNNREKSDLFKNKEQFLVSVLLTIYKVDEYLEECLDSLLAQTYQNLEIVCVDNGSPDRCGEILLKYQKKDSRIKIITLENNIKLCGGRNVSLDNATGDFICFVDPDDWIEKDWIKSMVSAIEQLDPDGEKYNLIINLNARDYIQEEKTRRITSEYTRNIPTGTYTIQDYNKNTDLDMSLPMWGRLYRKKFIDQYNIRFIEGLHIDNIPFTLKLLVHMKYFYIMSSGKKNDNNFYWRRIIIKDSTLTSHVVFRSLEIPKALDDLYDYLVLNELQNKIKVMYYNFFIVFDDHSDQPRLYSFYRKLMIKMENTIKDNPDLYGPEEVMLCNLLIYSNGFYDFKEKLVLSLGRVPSNQTISKSSTIMKFLGFIPLYKKLIDLNCIRYYIFGIPILKIKIKNNKYMNVYLFHFIRIIKKYINY